MVTWKLSALDCPKASGGSASARPPQRSFEVAGIRRRKFCQSGLTLVELIVAFTILLILSTMAVPLARFQIRRQREKDLRQALHDMRSAIDRYKDMADQGRIKIENDTYGYPKTLQVLVEGVPMLNTLSSGSNTGKMRFLRRIPKDPMTGGTEWGMRSMQDSPDSTSWGGQDVFDVYTKSTEKGSDDTPYSEW
jgi:general secretion pathway protein G